MRKFALIGAAGYVAPRHMRAIADVGGTVVAALDPSDAVGVLDSHFPEAHFFVEFERFDRHLDLLRRHNDKVDFVSVCSPNYLHDSHVRFALRSDADAICEKPLVLNPWNIDGLEEMEKSTGRRINTILQLRLHPSIADIKRRISGNGNSMHAVDLTYVTPRGRWYYASWKGDEVKSGGIATNIGVHLFDMLLFVFGSVKRNIVHRYTGNSASGYLELQKARVRWFLSLNREDLPAECKDQAFRRMTVDGQEIDFSGGFTDLHTLSYRQILAGKGFKVGDARASIELVSTIRSAKPDPLKDDWHPALVRALEENRNPHS